MAGCAENISLDSDANQEVEDADLTIVTCAKEDCVVGITSAPDAVPDDKTFQNGGIDKQVGDGSDSGVEVSSCCHELPGLQRAMSAASGDCASSCGGFEDSYTMSTTPGLSCDSSLISCYSIYGDTEDATCSTVFQLASGNRASEGGSESSSVTEKVAIWHRSLTSKKELPNVLSPKRRVNTGDVAKTSNASSKLKALNTTSSASTSRQKNVPSRQAATSTSRTAQILSAFGRSLSASAKRDKMSSSTLSSSGSVRSAKSSATTASNRSSRGGVISAAKVRSKSVCDSLSATSSTKRDLTSAGKCKTTCRASATSKNKPMSTSLISDGRWPMITCKASPLPAKRPGSVDIHNKKNTGNQQSSSGSGTPTAIESKATALEKYATLPRRNRCKSPEAQSSDTFSRAPSSSRDVSLNRAASLRKQHHHREDSNAVKSLPPYPRRRVPNKLKIYHEKVTQTNLTASDVQNAMGDSDVHFKPSSTVDKQQKEIQVELHIAELEELQERLKKLSLSHSKLQEDYDAQRRELEERELRAIHDEMEKTVIKEELERTNQKVNKLLGNVKGSFEVEDADGCNSLLELESHVQASTHVVIKQQQEINELQSLCGKLKWELEKSLAAQKSLLHQQQETEAESMELQEFLQAEKSTMQDSLKDVELEVCLLKQQLVQKDTDLQRHEDECRHLVRLSEQRRQENLGLQARLRSFHKRSKDLLLQQGAAVSSAAIALSSLGSRLEELVEQLVSLYNISEKDLEDVIFHNEAYSRSSSSVEASPEKTSSDPSKETPAPAASPQRRSSFVSAVINAICNAASRSPFNSIDEKRSANGRTSRESCHDETSDSQSDSPQSTTLLVTDIPTDMPSESLTMSESLQNLSQAILDRQKSEQDEEQGSPNEDLTIIYDQDDLSFQDYTCAFSLVDQVIDIDNLVTKLLKVIRIIKLDNDTNADELQEERNQLSEQIQEEQSLRLGLQERLDNWQQLATKLQHEVEEAKQQLRSKEQELTSTKSKFQQFGFELDNSLGVDSKSVNVDARGQDALVALQQWKRTGKLPPPDVLANVVAVCNEIPSLMVQRAEKERELGDLDVQSISSNQLLSESWMQVRRQYEAIDRALETLQSVQSIVDQCPALAQMQQELEDTNFQCIASLPIATADLNANAQMVAENGVNS